MPVAGLEPALASLLRGWALPLAYTGNASIGYGFAGASTFTVTAPVPARENTARFASAP